MSFVPYPHQDAGIDWIIDHEAAGLFWGMGTGKTVTTLTAIDRLLYDYLEDGPVLVIAPKRVAENTWSKECDKWPHLQHLRVSKVMGTPRQRAAALATPADLYVIGRDSVVWLVEHFGGRWPFPIVVIDELSSFKSAQAKRWKALRRVRGRIRRIIGLTGTPRPNGIEDLYAQVYLLDGGERLGRTLTAFRSRFLIPEKMNGHIVYSYRPREGAEEEIYERLADICMSIKKEDVLSLPGQIYEDVTLDLPPAVLKQYKTFERERVMSFLTMMMEDGYDFSRPAGYDENMKKYQEIKWKEWNTGQRLQDEADKVLKKTWGPEVLAGSAAVLTNKLLQFANGSIYDGNGNPHHIHSVKLDALEELLEAAGGDSVLVLYTYKQDADRIRERVKCGALDTPDDIDAWNRGEIPVALAHPASIGHGLNLQEGGHIIIWYGLPWSLELYQQANERLNRPGQKNVCIIYHLIAKGTHDERVLKSLSLKEQGQNAALEALRLDVLKREV